MGTTRHDRTTAGNCDDTRPASLAAALVCARCTCAATHNGLCREHTTKRRVMIRHSAERVDARHAYADRLATIAGQGRDHVLDDGDEIAAPTVALRGVL